MTPGSIKSYDTLLNDAFIRTLSAFNSLREEIYSSEYKQQPRNLDKVADAALMLGQLSISITALTLQEKQR